MEMPLKKKYRSLNEPRAWRNIAGKRNVPQFGTGGGISNKRKINKGSGHPIGMSGRTLSASKKAH